MRIHGKPIIKVYLLPEWSEDEFQNFLARLIEAAISIPALHVRNMDDVIVLFIKDMMTFCLGTEIHIEVDLPEDLEIDILVEQETAQVIGSVVQKHLPDAYVQCKVYPFHTKRGFWASATE